ncbi:MAG: glycosyltransferase [Rickettsiales bacterium]
MELTLALGLVVVGMWGYLLAFRGNYWHAENADALSVETPLIWPDIAVVIPARNEADMMGACLPTLLTNHYPGTLRVVLVDDRSEDGTAEMARAIAVECGATARLEVISAPPLAAGWKGKVAAMQYGFEHVAAQERQPEYVLFTDADIAYDSGSIAPLVAQSMAAKLVLNSRMVKLRCESTAERFLIPAFVHFFRMLYPFAWVNNPHHKLAAAAGGCMLVQYKTLARAGGLAAIRAALIDDCALGRLMKTHGPIWLGLTRQIRSLRPYPVVADIRAMVSRTAYDQLGYSPWQLAGSMLGMALMSIAPLWLALCGQGLAQLCGVVTWAAMSVSFVPMLRFYRQSGTRCLELPLVAACYMGFTFDSAIQYYRGRGGMWKGRAQAGSLAA